ncbi:MAG: nucleotidyltransferase domain-containing protein [Gammaproteobacteria bacterium]|nr:MAG: nucleotidyltransferase domain-containing protein [Gammaproteobacteria bacterium]
MRLSTRIISILKNNIHTSFGDVEVYLFGSRVDDNKLGGDIDLAIDTNINNQKFLKNKIKFDCQMIRAGYDLKVDLVKYNHWDDLLNRQIKNDAIKLF